MMKKYDHLFAFGCSFTWGGGLNRIEYHRALNNDPSLLMNNSDLESYRNKNAYPARLAELLNCDFTNKAQSGLSNESIFINAYNTVIKDLNPYKNNLVIIQTTLFHRRRLHYRNELFNVNMSAIPNLDAWLQTDDIKQRFPLDVIKYFYDYITKFYDEDEEFKRVIMEINLLNAWLIEKRIDPIFLIYDYTCNQDNYNLIQKSKNVISYVNHPYDHSDYSLCLFINKLKETITHMGIGLNDAHFSPAGHQAIADKIYEFLAKYQ